MVENPTTEEVFWSLIPDTDALAYGTRYVRPWRGKVRNIRNVAQSVLFCSFDPETGVLDSDANASVTTSFASLYRTEQEAWEAYDELLDKGMLSLSKERGVAAKRIADLRREACESKSKS